MAIFEGSAVALVLPMFDNGDIDYDEYYFEDIENTIKIIEDTFSDYDKLLHEYFYHSSW